MITPLPGAIATKPGSATLPFFGVEPAVVDDQGKEVLGNGVSGFLCFKRPWPAMARTIQNDHQRFFETYLKPTPVITSRATDAAATKTAIGGLQDASMTYST